MPDEPKAKRPSRGAIRKHFTAGTEFGKPLEEWGHVTPRYPEGIRDSDLRWVSAEIQKETALFWFLSNFKPYDLSTGGPWFGFSNADGSAPPNIAGFEVGRYAPSPIAAYNVLEEEFEGVVDSLLLLKLGETLGDNWMLKEHAGPEVALSGDDKETLIKRLDLIEERMSQLVPIHGGIGHNGAPDDLPLDREIQEEASDAIRDLKSKIRAGATMSIEALRKAWSPVDSAIQRVGQWLMPRLNTFADGFSDSGGKSLGTSASTLVLVGIGLYADNPYLWAALAAHFARKP